jgi:FG-GAP repeat
MQLRLPRAPSPFLSTMILTGLATLATLAFGQVIEEERKFMALDGQSSDQFGVSVAIDGGLIAVGARFDDDNGTNAGSAYLFNASTGTQIFKFLPNDAEEGDYFGSSIAMRDGIVVVGAPLDNEFANDSGSVYLFSAVTGAQIAKLLPDDPGLRDKFGTSVAIDNGIVVVGAPYDDNAGDDDAGSVYLFSASTGSQISKIQVADGTWGDLLGWSVGIDDGVVVAGRHSDDDNGANSGSAFLFNASTGSQIAKLLAEDGAAGDLFGISVAIDNGIVVVGARSDDDNGTDSGSVYLFDASTGEQITKLLPSDGSADEWFGETVAIHDDIVVAGVYKDDVNGDRSGSAYLFDVSTGNQIAKLLPSDGAELYQFGYSVAIHNGKVAIGSHTDDDNGYRAGSAYLFNALIDTDGDGLLDDWEINGIPYTKTDGTEGRYIIDYDGDGFGDANPNHKDLFIELDMMAGLRFTDQAIAQLEEAFRDAPVTNPGNELPGINIFIQVDEQTIPFQQEMLFPSSGWSAELGIMKGNYFGTALEHSGTLADEVAILEARAKAFRYCLLVNKIQLSNGKFIGGRAELPGNDLVITYGGGRHVWLASTFMHELGHNLNLRHGGIDNINMKPNYPSIMNYVLADPMPWSRDFWKLDYSREELDPLDEANLNEGVSVGGGGTGFYGNYKVPYFSIVANGAPCFNEFEWGMTRVSYVSLDPTILGVDFNLDCDTDDPFVQVDLNYLQSSGLPGSGFSSFDELLLSQNDWAVIQPAIPAGGVDFGDAPADDELTIEGRQFIMDNFPIPPGICEPDLTGDGILDFFDVQLFLNLYAAGEVRADFAFDGVFDFFDVQEFLNLYSAGCP